VLLKKMLPQRTRLYPLAFAIPPARPLSLRREIQLVYNSQMVDQCGSSYLDRTLLPAAPHHLLACDLRFACRFDHLSDLELREGPDAWAWREWYLRDVEGGAYLPSSVMPNAKVQRQRW
jgi:hypothetical protein